MDRRIISISSSSLATTVVPPSITATAPSSSSMESDAYADSREETHPDNVVVGYEVGRLLGKGSFASVYYARHVREGHERAIKILDGRRDEARGRNAREVAVHASVSADGDSHPNVVRLLESMTHTDHISGSNMTALVVELCSGGDLEGYMRQVRENYSGGSDDAPSSLLSSFLDERDIRHALSHVLEGLAFLHKRGIVHRDVKAPNIFLYPSHRRPSLLSNFQLKLGDFGFAVRMDRDVNWNESQTTFCGTLSCVAPEVMRHYQRWSNSTAAGYGQPADLWSMGCLLYTMIVGRNPFAGGDSNACGEEEEEGEKARQIILRVLKDDWEVPESLISIISDEIKNLLKKLMEEQPGKRGTAENILKHPFFQP